ncbi:glycogen synthase GlgA [Cylindrospermopsis raciborskii]|uniref:Glycogen synthase n=2 Tax=Cylindrospermopsis raciborskii TaxID=77022 RepID=A0A9Q5QZQ9_9CYAN|nr:glycogen synthase GlgA [Cylindrospermopsis raciborskii]MCZ2206459.1 glycogen synthase GlgA [Cylindrospermopsis raciborskii PAMP2011]NLQ03768.1 glycogen synthase GlgA [Cylindrospermopsis raciborskii MVCC19]OHY33958.1 starch synthase [Cylindrospermopsis raciborskii MVCC14]OPH11025.1 starch synthase [Cylindrospermopsis raciborskii CENA302]
MYIVQIASECAPVIKAGGLGDVVYGLSRELEGRGNTVELILPMYDCMRYDHVWGLHDAYLNLWVPWFGAAIHCSVYCGWVHGRVCFFIQPHSQDNFFNRGCYYGCNDDNMRFAFFSKAALEFLLQSNKRPDIIHCHDWQTGLIPVMLYEIYKYHGMEYQRVCYTIHNFKHQGMGGVETLEATNLNRPEYYFQYDKLRDNFNPFAINFMKAGINYANAITTVSPNHAVEAQTTEVGCGLGHTLYLQKDKFSGVLNGIDYDFWNAEIDRYIPHSYSWDDFEQKAYNKKALRERLMLQDDNSKPVIAYIGRLDNQKGVHLVHHAIYYALNQGAQFVLLGSATEPAINAHFQHEKQFLNSNPDVHLELGFNEELSHLIYAGSDMIVVPSNYEPCGLTQMIGLKYGTVPIVRGVGGLVNTVFDRDYEETLPLERRNGYVFYSQDDQGLESAMGRAIDLWKNQPKEFEKLAIQGMQYDYSWNLPGEKYLEIYDWIRHKW